MLPGHTAGRIAWMLLVPQLMGVGGFGGDLGVQQQQEVSRPAELLPPPSSGDERALLVVEAV